MMRKFGNLVITPVRKFSAQAKMKAIICEGFGEPNVNKFLFTFKLYVKNYSEHFIYSSLQIIKKKKCLSAQRIEIGLLEKLKQSTQKGFSVVKAYGKTDFGHYDFIVMD